MARDIDLVVALDSRAAQRLTGALGADYHADADAFGEAMRRAPAA